MGNDESKRKKQWSVATLNFAGITHSPFEFYNGSKEDQQQLQILSKIFHVLYQKTPRKIALKESKQVWDLSKIDKSMQRERYSPLYRKDVGIINGHLMSREQFEDKWDKQFNKNEHYVKFGHKVPSSQQKEDCKLFDFLIFKTFVEYIYNHDDDLRSQQIVYTLQDRQKKEQNLYNKKQRRKRAVLKYNQFLQYHFQKAFLKQDIKLARVKQIMDKKDILFIQDASDQLVNALKNEGLINVITRKGSDCAILIKHSFDKIYDQNKILQNQNNWRAKDRQLLKPQRFNYSQKEGNKTTVVCFVDNFILINVHLSKSDKNDQIIKLMKHLIQLQNYFLGLSIIAGGDFNKIFIFSEDQVQNIKDKQIVRKFYEIFQVFPTDGHTPTTSKKRTRLQAQNHKAEEKDQKCRDFLIADIKTLEVKNQKIQILRHLINLQERLMTERHPFDHWIVSASVKLIM